MRLVFGASLSVVNSGICPATLLSASVSVFGIDGADHDGRDARGDEIVHQPLLRRGRRLLGIFQNEIVVGQFALRLLDAGFGVLPEIGGAVDHEGQGLLVLGPRRSGQNRRNHGRGGRRI